MIEQNNSMLSDNTNIRFALSSQEKIKGLREIVKRLKKILHVYEKSLEPNSTYDYKQYISMLMLYVQTCDILYNGELINILINLETIRINNFEKPQIKKIVFETLNIAQYLLQIVENQEGLDKVGDADGIV